MGGGLLTPLPQFSDIRRNVDGSVLCGEQCCFKFPRCVQKSAKWPLSRALPAQPDTRNYTSSSNTPFNVPGVWNGLEVEGRIRQIDNAHSLSWMLHHRMPSLHVPWFESQVYHFTVRSFRDLGREVGFSRVDSTMDPPQPEKHLDPAVAC
jgi:hypothetical protein